MRLKLPSLLLLSLTCAAHAQPAPTASAPPPAQRKVFAAPSPEEFTPQNSGLLPTRPQSHAIPAATSATSWGKGLEAPPLAAAGPELAAPDLYMRLRDSVFLIVAGESYEHIVGRKGDRTVGSAVAIAKRTLLTNCHVINGHTAILAYGRSGFFRVKKQRGDDATDRCVLSIEDGRELTPVPGLRAVSDLRVGERAYTVGSPEGIESTLGEGIISGLHEITGMTLIQTTAQISRGSSGGGLFDTRGNLVGITTLKHVRGEALNFAIPADSFFRK